jgi:isopentenyl-diphosphate delta-isomerase
MLQQRSEDKPLWPGYWTNSCCSHPRRGETYDQATRRRLREELGVEANLSRLYRFEYFARFSDLGAERELCTVYVGNVDDTCAVEPNPREIRAWDWFDAGAIDDLACRHPNRFTPWFLLEWARLRGDRRRDVEAICSAPTGYRDGNHPTARALPRRAS